MLFLRSLRCAAPNTADLVAAFIRAKVAKGLSPKTIDNYESELRLFARAYPRLPLEPGPIEEFLAERGPAPETRITYHRTLRTFYRWAQRRGTIAKNPVDVVDAPVLPRRIARALEPDQVRQLLIYPHDVRIRAFLLVLLDTGIRLSEALTLTQADIGECTLRVRGKTGEREVPVSPFVRVAVLNALPWPWTRADTASKGVHRAFTRAGLEGKRASAHTLRHTFSRLWDGDETLLMKILGHTSLRMLHERYRPYDVKRASKQHRLHTPIRYVA